MKYFSITIGNRTLFSEHLVPILYLVGILLVNYFAINEYSILLYITTLATIILPFIFVFFDKKSIPKTHTYLLLFITVYLAFSMFANFSVGYNLIIPYIFVTVFIIVDRYRIDIYSLLKIHNTIFILYLCLSIFVYIGLIPLSRGLNIFEEQGLFLNIKTFIGFYGSTASIDSYAMFTAIVNILFGKRLYEKIIIAGISIISSLFTFRLTPIFALLLSVIIYRTVTFLVKRNVSYKILVASINFIIVFIFLFVFFIKPFVTGNFEFLLQVATHGRFSVWENMIMKFNGAEFTWMQQLFGLGKRISVNTEWLSQGVNLTTNSHNSFLDLMIKFGYVGILMFYTGISYLTANYVNYKYYLVALFILFVGITNSSTFSYSFPIYMFWIYTFYKNSHYKKGTYLILKNVKNNADSSQLSWGMNS